MKTSLTILLIILIYSTKASGWEHQYTFQDERLDEILFSNGEYICVPRAFGYSNYILKGHSLNSWSRSSTILDSELYNTIWRFMDIEWMATRTISNKLISIFHKTEYDFGNTRVHTYISLVSDDGNSWESPSNVMHVPDISKFRVQSANDSLSIVIGSYPWATGILPNDITRSVYDAQSNTWSATYLGSVDQQAFCYFSDLTKTYLSYRSSWATNVATLICYDGNSSSVIGDNYQSSAVAYNGEIFGISKKYSPWYGWTDSSASLSNAKNITFNGQRMVAIVDNVALGYSDNFGQSWKTTHIGNISNASIIEENHQFVALVSSSTNSSIYTLSSYPDRATVTSINGFEIDKKSIYFDSISNALYQTKYSTSLHNTNWVSYGLPIVGTASNIVIALPNSSDATMFFKIEAINN